VHSYKPACILALSLLSLPLWAAQTQVPGIPNFHQVNEHIYRGGQPADPGWRGLSDLGVKTVIDLRREGELGHSLAAEQRAVTALGMRYISFPMNGIVAPDPQQVLKILSLLDGPDPVFVHCREGKDRTGTVIACYRISHDRWQNRKAMDEAKSYGIHWFETGMKGYILGFHPLTQEAAAAPASQTASAQSN